MYAGGEEGEGSAVVAERCVRVVGEVASEGDTAVVIRREAVGERGSGDRRS